MQPRHQRQVTPPPPLPPAVARASGCCRSPSPWRRAGTRRHRRPRAADQLLGRHRRRQLPDQGRRAHRQRRHHPGDADHPGRPIAFRQNADNSMSATAIGNPVAFRQKRDGVDECFEGYAQRAEYDGAKRAARALRPRAPEARAGRDPQQLHLRTTRRTEMFKAEGRAAAAPVRRRRPRTRGCAACSSPSPMRRCPASPRNRPRPSPPTPVPRMPARAPRRGARDTAALAAAQGCR